MFNLFTDFSKKEIKRNKKTMKAILDLEDKMKELSDTELKNKTNEFKDRLSKGETLDDLLVETFAVVRETSSRTLGMKPYPVQILGGITLHNGQIAELKTGEGKALTNSSKILTPEGWKTVGDIKIGDYLFGRDGKPTKVLATYPQKEKKQVYEVELVDGRIQECCSEHLWEVYFNDTNKETQTVNTKFLYNEYKDNNFFLPSNKAIEVYQGQTISEREDFLDTIFDIFGYYTPKDEEDKNKVVEIIRSLGSTVEFEDDSIVYLEEQAGPVLINEIRKTDRYEDMTCFTVDSEDHLFLTGDFVVTHNTLVATMPAYLNALEGKGVHVITVNDYLAKRDMEQMRKIYNFLGLTTGLITYEMDKDERRANYNRDITYGTNNQIGFDYLKDNMVAYKSDRVQRPLHYAILDEIDSILIDEARTPLIISGKSIETTDDYQVADNFAKGLTIRIIDPKEEDEKDPFERKFVEEKVDVLVNEKDRTATLTGQGTRKAEKYFDVDNLADLDNINLYHNINNAVKANYSMEKDIDYVVKEGKVEIVDEFTGRILLGRRFSDGLHQALEAKEGVVIEPESKTFATITFQNLFRMYDKLSGMTGTAKTEEEEFSEIYKLDVVSIPTNKPKKRIDSDDFVFIDEEAKFNAIAKTVREIHETGQPILIGTSSIRNSEKVSDRLKQENIKHVVLNAKNNEKEAEIVAQAGRLGAVTIATNMAGRGTDIMLGGNLDFMARQDLKAKGMSDELIEEADTFYDTDNQEILDARKLFKKMKNNHRQEVDKEAEKVKELGGLYILGTERHDSRRVDNQLRGRSGRQGDPGYSKFFISLEDDLVRLNSTETLRNFVEKADIDKSQPIVSPIITKAVERAQRRVEADNFHIRKNTLKFDDVMNKQRSVVYEERNRVLDGANVHDSIMEMIEDTIFDVVRRYTTNDTRTELWHLNSMFEHLDSLNVDLDLLHFEEIEGLDVEDGKTQERIASYIYKQIEDRYNYLSTIKDFSNTERLVVLSVVDAEWVNHLDIIEQMKKEVNVRAIGNDDPIQVFTNEAFRIYQEMIKEIRQETTRLILDAVER